MNIINAHGLPDALVRAVLNDPYTSGGDISTTKLIDSPRRRVLRKKYAEVVVEDVSERIWSLMGQAVHTVLERAGGEAITEQRLYADVAGWSVSGQFDRLHLANEVLQDYKVCSTYKASGDASWERQLNVLRWLASKNGYKVTRLEVVAIFRDWKKSESVRSESYPQQSVQIIPVRVWSDDEVEAYLEERVRMHQQAEAGDLPECTDEERWQSETKYALIKDGGKRAKKVAASLEEIGVVPDGHSIQVRKGESRRCAGYCEVAPFCDQWQRIKQEQESSDHDVDY